MAEKDKAFRKTAAMDSCTLRTAFTTYGARLSRFSMRSCLWNRQRVVIAALEASVVEFPDWYVDAICAG